MVSFIRLPKKFMVSGMFLVWLFAGCKQIDVYEKSVNFAGNEWHAAFPAKGTFQINDTTSAYNIYVLIRHTDAYAYNNIWLNMGLQAPGDSLYAQKINLTLGNDAQGWEGSGMNDIWEVRKIINAQPRRFRKMGTYHFDIRQIMRDEPLKHVMSAGLRVEKAQR